MQTMRKHCCLYNCCGRKIVLKSSSPGCSKQGDNATRWVRIQDHQRQISRWPVIENAGRRKDRREKWGSTSLFSLNSAQSSRNSHRSLICLSFFSSQSSLFVGYRIQVQCLNHSASATLASSFLAINPFKQNKTKTFLDV